MKILITGGAGFVGSSLACLFRNESGDHAVTVVDNLKRRGSELNLPLLARHGIAFVHGDIRIPTDLSDLAGDFDLLIEASAEPSVHAGTSGSPQYVIQSNLAGTLNCLEFARKRVDQFLFLSSSRVYSIEPLKAIALEEDDTRFKLAGNQSQPGVSGRGVSELFTTSLPRSLYGATKLASELVIQEYSYLYGLKALINRCGVIAGAGQFGKVDQGFFALWVANHYFKKPLTYTGFGGAGKQVRDVLHPKDLYNLIKLQIAGIDGYNGQVFNVGGGLDISTSLRELTDVCRETTGNRIEIDSAGETNRVDIPLYVSDIDKVKRSFGWTPSFSIRDIAADIHRWIRRDEARLRQIFVQN